MSLKAGFIGIGEVGRCFAAAMNGRGVESLMSEATEALFHRSGALGLKDVFSGEPPSAGEVVAFLEKKLRT